MNDFAHDPQVLNCTLICQDDLEFLTNFTDAQLERCLRDAARERESLDMSPQEQQRHFTNVVEALESTADTWHPADTLELRHESMEPIRIRVSELPISLGRGQEASVCINDAEVSDCHCVLMRHGMLLSVADNNSSNGTFVNGRPITSCDLCEGDWLRLGRQAFEFRRV